MPYHGDDHNFYRLHTSQRHPKQRMIAICDTFCGLPSQVCVHKASLTTGEPYHERDNTVLGQ